MMLRIVDDAELTGCHTMNLVFTVDRISVVTVIDDRCFVRVGCMTNLESDMLGKRRDTFCEEVEAVNDKVALVSRLRIIAMTDVENIILSVFLHDEPRAAPESETFALSDGMEPVSFMLTNFLSGLQFDDIPRLLSDIAPDILIVVDVSQEADALRVFTLGIDEMLAFSDLPYLIFDIMSDGEECFLQLPLIDLCEEVGLIFYGVRTRCKPFAAIYPFRLGIMPGSDEVIVVSHLLIEGTELDEAVAH